MYWTGQVNWTFGCPATVSSLRVYVCRQYPGPTIVIADSAVGVEVQSGFANATFTSEYTESCAWLRLSPTVKSWREIDCGSPRYAFGRNSSTKPSPTLNLYPPYANAPPTAGSVTSAGASHAPPPVFHLYTRALGIVSLRSYRPGGWSPLWSM